MHFAALNTGSLLQMLNEGLQPNLVTYNTLLEVYAKRGMWCEAVGVLDTLEQQVGVVSCVA